ncbi:MAG: hypothetical protein ACXAC7_08055 [Candidatus Hodarchaeales archaeon]|jgi:hypothetical protein
MLSNNLKLLFFILLFNSSFVIQSGELAFLDSDFGSSINRKFSSDNKFLKSQTQANKATWIFNYEFNSSSGYNDQYISDLSFNRGAKLNINATWNQFVTSDVMDFGLYIGESGSESPGYGGDELTGWSMATGGASPEIFEGDVIITSSSYYLRLINFMGLDVNGTITIEEEILDIPWNFDYNPPFNVSIVLTGYSEDNFNESEFLSYLPLFKTMNLGEGVSTNIIFNYTMFFANQSYNQDLDQQILLNSVNGTGTTSKLNITALEYQKQNLDRQDIFLPQDGRAINATAIDEYLNDNPYDPDADYTIYLVNYSNFDSIDHSLDHWFNVTEKDPLLDVERHWWRLEWDNPMNFDAKFPYAGFGNEGRHFILDPYAFQWYLNWTVIWRGISTSDGLHDFYTKDLDEFQKTHDITAPTGQSAIMRFLGSWVSEIVQQVIGWSPLGGIPEQNSLAIEALVLNNVSHLGLSNEDLKWMVNEPYIISIYQELFPDSFISINVTFLDIQDTPELENILLNNVYSYTGDPPQDNWNYIDGYGVYSATWARRQIDFNMTKADVTVSAYLFVLDNTSFASDSIPWAGKEFTGLGGGGHVVQLMELDRLYYPPDRLIPRQGLTDVLTHETGHAIGFPHTFSSTQLGSDFLWDNMGYYPGNGNFSSIRMQSYQRYQIEKEIIPLKNELIQLASNYGAFPVITSLLNNASKTFEIIQILFSNHDYLNIRDSIDEIKIIKDQINTLISLNDITAPIIDSPSDKEFEEGTFNNWINWTAFDDHPTIYLIYQNGTEVDSDNWVSSVSIDHKIDYLNLGSYNFTIIVYDQLGFSVIDTIIVTVSPPSIPEISQPGIELTLILLVLSLIYFKRRKLFL